MQIFHIKRGDTSPGLRYALLPESVDLNGAQVQFQMKLRRGDTVIDNPASVESVNPPVVEYAWQEGETEDAGFYSAEFRVTYGDGTVETFPNVGFITVSINEDVPDMQA